MAKTLAIIMGIQGSGKSTFFKKYLEKDFVRVNLDALGTRCQECLLVEECIAKGVNYAVDNTNPAKADRQRYIPEAKAAGYRIVGYFIGAKVEDCLARNALREGKARVPDKAIFSTCKKMEQPSLDEGFDELFFVRNDGDMITVEPWQPNKNAPN
jgi:predicted kinase